MKKLDRFLAFSRRHWRQAVQSVKGSVAAWEICAFLTLLRALLSFRTCDRLKHAARCHGLAYSRITRSISHRLLARHLHYGETIWREKRIGWERYRYAMSASQISRTVVIKRPRDCGEKGVIIVYFEYNFLKLLSSIEDFDAFDEKWTVVFATSWSPTDYALLSLALSRIDGPVYVQPCNYVEAQKLKSFHPRLTPLNSLPCDWLQPSYYQPRNWQDRSIDILMVSNWAPFKRHWEFFKALQNLSPDLRVVCIGQPQDGCDLDDIRALAKSYDSPQNIEFLESVSIETVTEMQCDAKLSVIFSLREGCCVAAAESIMAGAVLAMRGDAHVGPKDYINEHTGVLLKRYSIAEQLADALTNGHCYAPAKWARENIAAEHTCAKLNELLRLDAQGAGRRWTIDLSEPAWRPYPIIFRKTDIESLAPAYADLHQQYPNLFGEDLLSHNHC